MANQPSRERETIVVTKKPNAGVIEPIATDIESIELGILGISPYIHNRLAEKAKQELLYPKGPKNAAEKASTPKHDPVEEFRASPYRMSGDDAPTLLAAMASSFKGAMRTAALDLPGATGAQIGRLVTVEGHYIPFWGSVQLHMGITRSADINRTPDVRTRAISPEWGTIITVSFVRPLITKKTVLNLLSTGGRSAGVGDWRPQKGKGSFGQFRIVNTDDPDLLEVMQLGRSVQKEALEEAEPYDDESAELMTWYMSERIERGQ
jgi:hypothetical protein